VKKTLPALKSTHDSHPAFTFSKKRLQ